MADPGEVEVFTAYVDDLGRIGDRHERLREFYVTLISALFVFLALGENGGLLAGVRDDLQLLVGIVGILICVLWHLHMWSFAALFDAKKRTMRDAEVALKLSFGPFTEEAKKLRKPGESKPEARVYIRLTIIDRFISGILLILFIVLLFLKA
jgi:hypothetical protein